IPMTSSTREITEAGGFMSYGSNIVDANFQVGAYVGRILKGARPADLPVIQVSKMELVINHQTARMLGLPVPDKLFALADEVIECLRGAVSSRCSAARQRRGRSRRARSSQRCR